MKKALHLFIVLILTITFNHTLQAQCKGYAKKICKLELIPYIHDGNFHAASLTEGEEAELYKTFYAGQNYRIAVCAAEKLKGVEFQVIDSYKNVLYDNRNNKDARTWDFKLESSQQLKIAIKVPVGNPDAVIPESGCVAIMFGIKE